MQKSNTEILFDLFVSRLESSLKETINVVQMKPIDIQLRNCVGCEKCFNNGFCPLDAIDSFNSIKDEMLSADLIVLGSPVYGGAVSGDMKSFIDRLSYWCHLMPLVGKYGIPIVTASANHVLETTAYLTTILETYGLCVPCAIPCTVDVPPMLSNSHFIDQTLMEYAEKIASYYQTGTLTSSPSQENYFENLKRMYSDLFQVEHVEVSFWREHGYLNCDSFAELQAKICE